MTHFSVCESATPIVLLKLGIILITNIFYFSFNSFHLHISILKLVEQFATAVLFSTILVFVVKYIATPIYLFICCNSSLINNLL